MILVRAALQQSGVSRPRSHRTQVRRGHGQRDRTRLLWRGRSREGRPVLHDQSGVGRGRARSGAGAAAGTRGAAERSGGERPRSSGAAHRRDRRPAGRSPGSGRQPGAHCSRDGAGRSGALLGWPEAHRPFATEGGHAGFAPADEPQTELLRYLLRRFDPVSWERVLSGAGVVNIYSFLRDTGRGEEPSWLTDEISAGEPAAVISNAALSGRSRLCREALDPFVALYGAEAGNLALKIMTTGGVFVAGGIAPRILPRLRGPGFVRAFVAKGRMRPLLESMLVRVVLNDRLALLGAARYAATEESI